MTKNDLFILEENLKKVGNLQGVKFNYALVKNRVAIEKETNVIREIMQNFTEEQKEYHKERNEMLERLAEKDKDGNSKKTIIGNQAKYDIKDLDKLKKEEEKLESKYKKAIDELKAKDKEVSNLLQEEINIDFHKIKNEDVPEGITGDQMYLIKDFLTL